MADDLRLRVILDVAGRAAEKLRGIAGGSADLSAKLKAARDELKKLEGESGKIEKFRQVSKDLAINSNALKTAQDRVRELAVAIKSTDAPTKKMQREFDNAAKEAKRLKDRGQGLTEQQERLRRELVAAGVPLKGMADHQAKLRGQIQQATNAVKAQTDALEAQSQKMEALDRLKKQHGRQMMHVGMIGAAGAAMQAAGRRGMDMSLGPVRQFMAHEDAMLGIQRQVPGARDEMGRLTEVYRTAERQVRELSKQIPLATTEIADMMTAAARMEVPTEHLADQVKLAAEMAVAFDAVPDEIAESMGQVAKNYNIPITAIRGLADAINYLDDNAISKGSDIISYLKDTAGVMATAKMTVEQNAALGSTLLTAGANASSASTAVNALFVRFGAGEKGAKRTRAAIADLGLSAAGLAKGVTQDAMGTLSLVLDKLAALPEQKRLGIMTHLVGQEHMDTLAQLLSKRDELQRQIGLATGTEAQGSMAREAQARYAALSAQWQMMKNRAFDLSAAVGESLKPAIVELFNAAKPWIERAQAWIQQNPALVSGLMKAALAGSALLAVLGTAGLVLASVMAPLLLLRFGIARLLITGTGLMRLLPLLKLFGGALLWLGKIGAGALLAVGKAAIGFLFTPMGAALALLAGAAYLVWKNWDGIKGGLAVLWQQISSGAAALWQGVVDMKNRFVDAGAQLINGLISGITGRLAALKSTIVEAASSAAAWFKQKLGIQSPSRVFMALGANIPEGAAIGIERGSPRLRAAAAAMLAMPAMVGAAPLGMPGLGVAGGAAPAQLGGSSTIHITINAAPGQDPQAIARAVAAELDRRERRQRSRVLSQLADIDG